MKTVIKMKGGWRWVREVGPSEAYYLYEPRKTGFDFCACFSASGMRIDRETLSEKLRGDWPTILRLITEKGDELSEHLKMEEKK